MDSRQKIEALCAAAREGKPLPEWAKLQQTGALNNLNLKSSVEFKPIEDKRSLPKQPNLNHLKAEPDKKQKGVPRLELYTDEIFKKAMSWGVEEWLLQVCIRDYGIYTVKAQINRIYSMPEGYFKPKYGPIPQQRGRIFNKEMQKLKQARR